MPASRLAPVLLLVLGCASSVTVTPAPGPAEPHPEPQPSPPRSEPVRQPLAPPADAARVGWMPLASTGVPLFASQHPEFDGRGVLIAILDSGIDPGIPGLDRTSTGQPKLVDLRDFSREGRVELRPLRMEGDSVWIGSTGLAGGGRLRALAVGGVGNSEFYGGMLSEIPLGQPPAADLNGNGRAVDDLPVFVVRARDGWVLFADTDSNGTLANERPVRDYAVAGEWFTWRTGSRAASIGIAVNLDDRGDGRPPVLDLVFDTSGHGTHVAGIASGHDMYRVPGFHGVAPGAELLGLKISNDARGGVTVSGSILRAVDYAIRYARGRSMPLVINLSFGVGNEAEGAARIDHLLDSLLAVHPDVVMTVSAGNDGPGLSTIGFPGSARRVVSVGASYPGVFLPPGPGGTQLPDGVAFFSARGGELPRPDLVVPGLAYSTVARWDVGEEVKSGTSMASPHVAGLAARLISGLSREQRPVEAEGIRIALMRTARRLTQGGATRLDQGAGQAWLPGAWEALTASATAPALEGEGVQEVEPGREVFWRENPRRLGTRPDTLTLPLAPGGISRVPFVADSGRAFRLELADSRGAPLLLFLHEPGGMPARGQPVAATDAEEGQAEAVLAVDGRDVGAGTWEAVVVAGPALGGTARLVMQPAPIRVGAERRDSAVLLRVETQAIDPVSGTAELSIVGAERGLLVGQRGDADLRVPLVVPEWVAGLEVELQMDPGQWPAFTDFGLTLEDARGRVLEVSPLNYALGRLRWEPSEAAPRDLRILLSPGFADPDPTARWEGRLAIRFYAAEPAATGTTVPLSAGGGEAAEVSVPLPETPWPADPAWDPLARITVTAGPTGWTTEVRLLKPLPPVMP